MSPWSHVAAIAAIESAGYGAIWHGQRSHHSVAIGLTHAKRISD
jgi:hypothetical protein